MIPLTDTTTAMEESYDSNAKKTLDMLINTLKLKKFKKNKTFAESVMLKQKLSIYTKQLKKKRPHRKSGNNLTQKNWEYERYHTPKILLQQMKQYKENSGNKAHTKTRRFMDKDMTYADQQTKKKKTQIHTKKRRNKVANKRNNE